jgi:hypothetical protein
MLERQARAALAIALSAAAVAGCSSDDLKERWPELL